MRLNCRGCGDEQAFVFIVFGGRVLVFVVVAEGGFFVLTGVLLVPLGLQ